MRSSTWALLLALFWEGFVYRISGSGGCNVTWSAGYAYLERPRGDNLISTPRGHGARFSFFG